jgi:hypothetical protein
MIRGYAFASKIMKIWWIGKELAGDIKNIC